jgi:hypothetical protein
MLYNRIVVLGLIFYGIGTHFMANGAPRGIPRFMPRTTITPTKGSAAAFFGEGWVKHAMQGSAMTKYLTMLSTKTPRLAWLKFLGSQWLGTIRQLPASQKIIDRAIQYKYRSLPSQPTLLFPE